MISKEKKQSYIKEMTTQFDKSEAVIVAHYQGLTVKQLDELRKKMREHGIQFKITKNRITKFSLEKLVNIFADVIASDDKAIAVGPLKSFDNSLHLVFSKASLVILFFVILN